MNVKFEHIYIRSLLFTFVKYCNNSLLKVRVRTQLTLVKKSLLGRLATACCRIIARYAARFTPLQIFTNEIGWLY